MSVYCNDLELDWNHGAKAKVQLGLCYSLCLFLQMGVSIKRFTDQQGQLQMPTPPSLHGSRELTSNEPGSEEQVPLEYSATLIEWSIRRRWLREGGRLSKACELSSANRILLSCRCESQATCDCQST